MEEDDYESLPPNASTTDHMIAGAAAGVMEHCIIYPVDVIKVIQFKLKKKALTLINFTHS